MSPIIQSLANGSARGYGAFVPSGAAGNFESIASATGSGSSANILFSSIPQTYKHLQIRITGRSSDTSSNAVRYAFFQCNSDFPTTSSYGYHGMKGNGSAASVEYALSFPTTSIYTIGTTQSTGTQTMGAIIMDLHDYTSTTKNKTFRMFGGGISNTSYGVGVYSGYYQSTTAITQLRVSINTANWSTNTTIALYGIKGA